MTESNRGFAFIAIVVVVAIILGLVGYIVYQKLQFNTQLSQEVDNKFEVTQLPIDEKLVENESYDWVKTDIAGGGIVFEYPAGWHIATHVPIGAPLGKNAVLVSKEPIMVDTTHGPDSNFVISIQNGLLNPEEELDKLYNEQRDQLEEVNEEIMTNKFYKKIYHLQGKISGDGMRGGNEVDKYFFITDNSEYKDLSDKMNLNIIIASGEPGDLLKDIVMSFKYCSYTHCLDEIQ